MHRAAIFSSILILLSMACTGQTPKKDTNPNKPDATPSKKIKFTFPGSGVGPDPTTHVTINKGQEAEVASRCILDTLSDYGFKLKYPQDKSIFPLKALTTYSTSTVRLRDDLKKIVANADPSHPLPSDMEIWCLLSLSFEQGEKFWVFRIACTLYTKDRTTEPEEYKGRYDSDVIPNRILTAIDTRLTKEHPKTR